MASQSVGVCRISTARVGRRLRTVCRKSAHIASKPLAYDRSPVTTPVSALRACGTDRLRHALHRQPYPVPNHVQTLFVQPAIPVHGRSPCPPRHSLQKLCINVTALACDWPTLRKRCVPPRLQVSYRLADQGMPNLILLPFSVFFVCCILQFWYLKKVRDALIDRHPEKFLQVEKSSIFSTQGIWRFARRNQHKILKDAELNRHVRNLKRLMIVAIVA